MVFNAILIYYAILLTSIYTCKIFFPERPSIYAMFHHVEQSTTYMCGPRGWQYNEDGVRIMIPPGAVKSHVGVTVGLRFADLGPFEFPPKMKPVSPLLFTCMGRSKFTFRKPVEITLPHCVKNTSGRQRNLQFLKAEHCMTDRNTFSFEAMHGDAVFSADNQTGTIHTNHFCLLCISEEISDAEYVLVKVVPRPLTTRECDVIVCVILAHQDCEKVSTSNTLLISYLIRSYACFAQTVRSQYPGYDVKVHPQPFTFSEQNDEAVLKLVNPRQSGQHRRSRRSWEIWASPTMVRL